MVHHLFGFWGLRAPGLNNSAYGGSAGRGLRPRHMPSHAGYSTSWASKLPTKFYSELCMISCLPLSVPPGCFPQRPGFDRLCGTPGWVTAKGPDPAFCKGYQNTARRVKLSQCGGFHIYPASYQITRPHFQETLEFWIREPVAVTSWQNCCRASRE